MFFLALTLSTLALNDHQNRRETNKYVDELDEPWPGTQKALNSVIPEQTHQPPVQTSDNHEPLRQTVRATLAAIFACFHK